MKAKINYMAAPGIVEQPFEQHVLNRICEHYNKVAIEKKGYKVTPEAVKAKTRKQYIKEARQLTCFFIKKHTDNTLNKIGWIIGGKDHASVIHSVRTIDTLTKPKHQLLIPVEVFENLQKTFEDIAPKKKR